MGTHHYPLGFESSISCKVGFGSLKPPCVADPAIDGNPRYRTDDSPTIVLSRFNHYADGLRTANSVQYAEEQAGWYALGVLLPLPGTNMVVALLVDPVADIVVLGMPDGQYFEDANKM